MKTISFVNMKDGVGKTTLAIMLQEWLGVRRDGEEICSPFQRTSDRTRGSPVQLEASKQRCRGNGYDWGYATRKEKGLDFSNPLI